MARAGRRTLMALALAAAGMSALASEHGTTARRSRQGAPPKSDGPAKCWDEKSPDPLGGLPAADADCAKLRDSAHRVSELSSYHLDAADASAVEGYKNSLADQLEVLSVVDGTPSPRAGAAQQKLKQKVVALQSQLQSRLRKEPGSIPPGPVPPSVDMGTNQAPPASLRLSLDNFPLIVAFFALAVGLLAISMEVLKRPDELQRARQLQQLTTDVAAEKETRYKDVDHLSRAQQQLRDRVEALTDDLANRRPGPPAPGAADGDGQPPTRLRPGKATMPIPGSGDDSSYGPGYGPGDFDDSSTPYSGAPPPATRGDGFLGTVSDLLRRAPAGSRTMRYDNAAKLLIDGPAPDFGYTVFADPETRAMCVLPCLQRASLRTELFGFEALFEVEGPGSGAVSVTRHPHLEAIGTAFRVVDKGRLRVG